MNEKKIAFIMCVNNELYYQECCSYINDLYIPDGYEIDIIAVNEAESMASGYNAAMKASDAKYKIYLHQDVFIFEKNLISLILEIFEDENIGMCGLVGSDHIIENGDYAYNWNIVNTDLYISSKIVRKKICNYSISNIYCDCDKYKLILSKALDGMFMATQIDVEWDESNFNGWDYYDISECFKVQDINKKVVTIVPDSPWTLHVEGYSVPVKYDIYREIFCKKYDAYGHIYDNKSVWNKDEYDIFLDKKEEFLEVNKNKVDTSLDYVQLLKYIKELQSKIVEIGNENMQDNELRIMFTMLTLALEDIYENGKTVMWPANPFEESYIFFQKLLFLIWKVFYKNDEDSIRTLELLIANGIVSKTSINFLKKKYIIE